MKARSCGRAPRHSRRGHARCWSRCSPRSLREVPRARASPTRANAMNPTATPRSDEPSARSDMQELSNVVADLRRDFGKLRDAVMDLGREKVGELRDAASETIEDRKRRADELTNQLCDTI